MAEVKITSHEERCKREIDAKLKRALKIIGMQAESYAKMLCPVDTGLLRNSITYAIGGEMPHNLQYTSNDRTQNGEYTEPAPPDDETTLTLYIGTNVHYAPYQELGHYTVKENWVDPQPFLRPAIENHISEYQQILKREAR